MTTTYVLDDLVLIAGLTPHGTEHDAREFSRLVDGASNGGPPVEVPAVCLAVAAQVRPEILGHVAGLVAGCPPDAVTISGLRRTPRFDELEPLPLPSGWAATHAAIVALDKGRHLVTVEPERYVGTGAVVVSL